jgi:hypothetical protein
VRLVHIAVAKQAFFRFLHFWPISLPTGLFCKKWQFFVLHTKIYIADRAFFDPIFSFWHKPSAVKNRKNHFCEKTCFSKNSKSEKIPRFFKNAKNCNKKFSPFSGKVDQLFSKTAFFAEKCPLFSMKFSRNSEAGADFLIVIFGEFPKGEILEKTSKNGRNLTKSHPEILRNLCIN